VKVFRTETLQDSDYNEIVLCLSSGGVIGFPTDTAYGLGADPHNQAAIDRIFAIKGRPDTKPLLVIVDSVAMAESVSRQLPQSFYDVAGKFWPGPLTLIVRSDKSIPRQLTAGTNTIGIRWPIAPFATTLVQRFGKPITATSANQSGMPSTVTAGEVRAQLGASLDMLIDGGTLPARSGSTVLDLTVEPAIVLREGPITFQSLYEFFEGNIRRNVA
jgi:L-threonylcarbamoyladenylate synthase